MEIPKSSFLKTTALTLSAAVAFGAGSDASVGEQHHPEPTEQKIEAMSPPEGHSARQRTLGVYVVTIAKNGEPVRDFGYHIPGKMEGIVQETVDGVAQSTLNVEQIQATDMGSYIVDVASAENRCASDGDWLKFLNEAGRAAKAQAKEAGKVNKSMHDLFFVDVHNCAEDSEHTGVAYTSDQAAYVYGAGTTQIAVHEIGHDMFGLGHSGIAVCDQQCKIDGEYDDPNSAMGNLPIREQPDLFNGPQLAQMGIVKPEQIIDVTDSGTHEISPLLKPDTTTPKLLRIKALRPGPDGKDNWYYWAEVSSRPEPPYSTSIKLYLGSGDMVEKAWGITPGVALLESAEENCQTILSEEYGGQKLEISLADLDPDYSGKASSGQATLKVELSQTTPR